MIQIPVHVDRSILSTMGFKYGLIQISSNTVFWSVCELLDFPSSFFKYEAVAQQSRDNLV